LAEQLDGVVAERQKGLAGTFEIARSGK